MQEGGRWRARGRPLFIGACLISLEALTLNPPPTPFPAYIPRPTKPNISFPSIAGSSKRSSLPLHGIISAPRMIEINCPFIVGRSSHPCDLLPYDPDPTIIRVPTVFQTFINCCHVIRFCVFPQPIYSCLLLPIINHSCPTQNF